MEELSKEMLRSQQVTFDKLEELLVTSLHLQKHKIKQKDFCSIPYIQGPPGIGKSEYMKYMISDVLPKLAIKNGEKYQFLSIKNSNELDEKEWTIAIKYLATMALEQMTGLPIPMDLSKQTTFHKWSVPSIFDMSEAKDYIKEDSNIKDTNIILFLDDVHLVKSNMSPYLFQLFSYRSIHGYKLPDNVLIVCAGNGPNDNSGYQKIPAAIVNRYVFYYVKPDVDVWVKKYAIKHNVRPEIISFLMHDSQWFSTLPINDNPHCTPRSWVSFSDHISSYYDLYQENKDSNFVDNFGYGLLETKAVSKYREYIDLIYQWEAEKILSGNKEIDFDSLDKIDAYSLMISCTGEIIKMIRNKEKIKEQLKEIYIKNMNNIITCLSVSHKPIVPLGLTIILRYEGELWKSQEISRQLLTPEISCDLYEIV